MCKMQVNGPCSNLRICLVVAMHAWISIALQQQQQQHARRHHHHQRCLANFFSMRNQFNFVGTLSRTRVRLNKISCKQNSRLKYLVFLVRRCFLSPKKKKCSSWRRKNYRLVCVCVCINVMVKFRFSSGLSTKSETESAFYALSALLMLNGFNLVCVRYTYVQNEWSLLVIMCRWWCYVKKPICWYGWKKVLHNAQMIWIRTNNWSFFWEKFWIFIIWLAISCDSDCLLTFRICLCLKGI